LCRIENNTNGDRDTNSDLPPFNARTVHGGGVTAAVFLGTDPAAALGPGRGLEILRISCRVTEQAVPGDVIPLTLCDKVFGDPPVSIAAVHDGTAIVPGDDLKLFEGKIKVVEDATPPEVTCELVPVDVDNDGNGLYEVAIVASDNMDPEPRVRAYLQCGTQRARVTAGQIVSLELNDGSCSFTLPIPGASVRFLPRAGVWSLSSSCATATAIGQSASPNPACRTIESQAVSPGKNNGSQANAWLPFSCWLPDRDSSPDGQFQSSVASTDNRSKRRSGRRRPPGRRRRPPSR
jgi:hypothetical protein